MEEIFLCFGFLRVLREVVVVLINEVKLRMKEMRRKENGGIEDRGYVASRAARGETGDTDPNSSRNLQGENAAEDASMRRGGTPHLAPLATLKRHQGRQTPSSQRWRRAATRRGKGGRPRSCCPSFVFLS